MKIQQLLCFNEIVKTKSFSAAATNLFLSQPSVSYNIRELENDLGISLFIRGFNNNDVELTEQGKVFLSYTREIVDLFQQCENVFKDLNAIEKNRVRIACNDQMTYGLVPALIKYAYYQYPTGESIFVEVHSSNTPQDTDQAVAEAVVDFALYAEVPADPSLCCEPIGEEEIVAYLPENHPLAHKERIHLADMGDLPVAVPGNVHSGIYHLIQEMFRYEGIQPILSEHSGVILQSRMLASMSGSCYTLGADFPLQVRGVSKVRLDNPYRMRKIYAIWKKDRPLSECEKNLISFCKRYYSSSKSAI